MSHRGKVVVTGAGGFIGHHLVAYLKRQGYWVRGVDLKYPEFSPTASDEFLQLDLRRRENCLEATHGVDEVYALAADMGGMGFISSHHAQICTTMRSSTSIPWRRRAPMVSSVICTHRQPVFIRSTGKWTPTLPH